MIQMTFKLRCSASVFGVASYICWMPDEETSSVDRTLYIAAELIILLQFIYGHTL